MSASRPTRTKTAVPATARPTAEQLCSSPREPDRNCQLCPRLAAFRDAQRVTTPDWFNAPVPSFGVDSPALIIVGLAPGLKGGNRTGRPLTGDYAGGLLYATLAQYGFLAGTYDARPDDGISLTGCMITNAVRCVPPQNKPVGAEIATCRSFLTGRIGALGNLRAILALGRIAHQSTIAALAERPKDYPFVHGGRTRAGSFDVFASYHCSRYNTNTGRLTPAMFQSVFADIRQTLDSAGRAERT